MMVDWVEEWSWTRVLEYWAKLAVRLMLFGFVALALVILLAITILGMCAVPIGL
jgi:hypothetical protein